MRQKKINDSELLKLFKQGMPQKDIAKHFGVSPVAVCKRLKRLIPPPKSLEKLTDKERRFAVEVVKGRTATQAALNSFDVSSMNSAKVIGSQLMQKPDVKMAIDDLMEYHGLTRSYRIQRLKEHVDHQDPVVSLKALDMGFKLTGEYAPEKHQTVSAQFVISDELRKQVSESLKELGLMSEVAKKEKEDEE
ncbi:MAG: terminase small subunit [Nitrospinae bacterium]|nr:terminase small subunit [Nitrospinota bacterium]